MKTTDCFNVLLEIFYRIRQTPETDRKMEFTLYNGEKKTFYSRPNTHGNCWLNSLLQLFRYVDEPLFESEYLSPENKTLDMIKQLSDYTKLDLSDGGPPALVLWLIKDCLNTGVGTSTRPGEICVINGVVMTLADFHAGIFLKGTEHAVFALNTSEGWYAIDDEVFYPWTPDPADVLAYVPYDQEPLDVDWQDRAGLFLRGAGQSSPATGSQNQSGNTGSIINNYYMQQYQNSMDTQLGDNAISGGSNEGSTDTTSTHTNNTQNNDWFSKLAQSAISGLFGALLADKKTEETTLLEDRIVTTRHGTTTSTTQSSVGITYGYADADSFRPGPNTSGLETRVEQAERFFKEKLFDWTPDKPFGTLYVLELPKDHKGIYGSLTDAYAYMRNGWDVQVTATSTQFNGGSLLVAMVPELCSLRDREEFQLSLYPHQFINPRTNTTAHIQVPYLGVNRHDQGKRHQSWSLVVMVLTPLTTEAQMNSGTVEVYANIAPTNVFVAGEMPAKQGIIPVACADGYGGFQNTDPKTADPIYGYVYNPSRNDCHGRYSNLLDVAEACPTFLNFDGKPYVVTKNNGDKVMTCFDVAFTHKVHCNTYLAGLADYYTQYQGSLNYHFMYTGPTHHKAKFMVAYIPPGVETGKLPKTPEDAAHCYHSEWDTGLNSQFTFAVPYVSASDFSYTHTDTPAMATTNGWVTVYQVTDTHSAEAAVVVSVSAGPDLEFRFPIDPVRQTTSAGEGADVVTTDPSTHGGSVLEKRRMHTDVAFVLDRFTHVHTNKTTFSVDLLDTKNQTLVGAFLRASTYYFCDLEIACVGDHKRVYWQPNGAPRTTQLGDNPMVFAHNGVTRFAIPYTAPHRLLATVYNGECRYTERTSAIRGDRAALAAKYAESRHTLPSTFNFGHVTADKPVDVYYRMKRAELYCPRPLLPAYQHNGRDRFDAPIGVEKQLCNFDLLKLAGDVESNPGPFFFADVRENFTKLVESINNMQHDMSTKHGPDFNRLVSAFEELTQGVKAIKDGLDEAKPWYKVIKLLSRLSCMAAVAARSKDPVLVAIMLADTGLEILDSTFVVKKISDALSSVFHVPAPVFSFGAPILLAGLVKVASAFFRSTPEDLERAEKQLKARDINDIFAILKNGEWLVKLILAIRDWIKAWISSEEKYISMTDLVPRILECQRNLNDPSKYQESKEWLENAREACLKNGNTHIANLCKVNAPAPSKSRPEPVVVCLRGKSGQGKSFLANVLAQAISTHFTGRVDSVWYCPPDPDHFDGYNQQAVVVMDDLGQNPDGKDFKYFAQMVSTTGFIPPMASLEDKGKPFNSKVIIATSNLYSGFTPRTMVCPDALNRRFHFDIDVSAKDGYKVNNRLDIIKALEDTHTNAPAMFNYDCALLNGSAVEMKRLQQDVFKPLPPLNSLYQLVDEVIERVKLHEKVSSHPIFKQISIPSQKSVLYFLIEKGQHEAAIEFYEGMVDASIKEELKPLLEHTSFAKRAFKRLKENFEIVALVVVLLANIVIMIRETRKRQKMVDDALDEYIEKANITTDDKTLEEAENSPREVVDKPTVGFRERKLPGRKTDEEVNTEPAEPAEKPQAEGPYAGPLERQQPLKLKAKLPQAEGPYAGPLERQQPLKLKTKLPVAKEGPYEGPVKKPVALKVKARAPIVTESGCPPTDLQKMVMANVKPVELILDGKTVALCCATGVFGTAYLVPRHLFAEKYDKIMLDGRALTDSDFRVFEFEVKVKGQDMLSDAALMVLHSGNRVRDLTGHFRDTMKLSKGSPVVGVVNNADVGRLIFSGDALTYKDLVVCMDGDTMPGLFAYRAGTKVGYCGAAVLAKDGAKTVIVGTHSAGGNGVGYCSCVSRSMLLQMKAHIDPPPHTEGLVVDTREVEERVHVMRKTKLAPTVAHGVFQPGFGPAALSNNDKRLNEGVVLDEVIFSKHKGDAKMSEADKKLFRLCAADYASHLHNVLGTANSPLSVFEAIKGVDGLDAMEPDTAPGLPWALQGKRRGALIDFENGTVGPEIEQALKLMEKKEYKFTCQTFLKDEIRPLEKVRAGKTRIVDVLPVEHIIYTRMMIGRFCAQMHSNNGPQIGSAVGCNPDVDWQRFGTHFAQYKNVWDIDYSAFDANHCSDAMNIMFEEVFREEFGFHPNAVWILKTLINTEHAYENKRITVEGGMPSGCSATSIINTILNNIYVLYALRRHYEGVELSHYTMISYGDDIVVASDYDLDFEALKPHFKSLGQTITPADKSDKGFVLGQSITDVTFLKRHFYLDYETGFYKPVMASKTLEAILSFARRGTIQEKLISVAGLAVHSGQDEYRRLFEPFQGTFEIPSYRSLYLRWVNAVCGDA
nr:polyprotein [Foot-and-mouth disease virus]UPO81417.1 polyprotein [Foot-and-mouth disease virus]UPO81418.1 polyprotein [Foot-and-mouth disease virus]UPO81419.1 polyprotein [Foot-and-mouth disease virus]UPO81421.1 polyprotein [Foot-and-mouth disease virus]